MTLTIGRFSSPKVKRVDVDGDRVTFGFDLHPSGAGKADDLQAMRQQLIGLVGNEDEPVVPLTWTLDSTFDGFYRPVSSTPGNSRLMIAKSFWGDASITLERLTGYANPWFEVTTQSVVRTNGHAITTPSTIIATAINTNVTPDFEYDLRPSLSALTPVLRAFSDSGAATPALRCYRDTAPRALTQFRYATTPTKFYWGSCRVEMMYGSTWYEVVGRNAVLQAVASRRWRISNGIVRLTSVDSSSGTDYGQFEVWNGTAWESRYVRHWLGAAVNAPIGQPVATGLPNVTILRNSPECVTVRCSGVNVDFTYTIQRGNRHIVWSWTSADSSQYGVGFNTSHFAASTAVTGGIRATADDANGNRMVFGNAGASTPDTTNGGIYLTAGATSGSSMIGVEFNGSTAITGDTAAAIIEQFIGAVSWRQRVIVR